MQVTSGLTSGFATQTGVDYSMQMTLSDNVTTYVASGLASSFSSQATSKFSIQKKTTGAFFNQASADWMQVTSGLTSGFATQTGVDYSMQMTLSDNVTTYVASGLASSFSSQATSKFSIQKKTTGAFFNQASADWMQVTSGLTSGFATQTGVDYSMQMTLSDNVTTYVASGLASDFSSQATSKFSIQKKTTGAFFNQASADWMQVTSGLT